MPLRCATRADSAVPVLQRCTLTFRPRSSAWRLKTSMWAVQIPYDILIVAVGAVNNTFHTPGVQEHAFFLKEVRCANWHQQDEVRATLGSGPHR